MFWHIFRMFRYWTSYRIATSFFDSKTRDAVLTLYSFVRIPDNIVDEPTLTQNNNLSAHYTEAKKRLEHYVQERKQAYTTNNTTHATLGEYVTLFTHHSISFAYSEAFFESMIMDATQHRYQRYEQLDHYMYGSAAAVWLMMCEIMNVRDEQALHYAHALGDAMQLTNFLRDIKEDYIDLDRIYLPEQDLQQYGLDHEDIISFCNNIEHKDEKQRSAFHSYMRDQIAHCRSLYQEAEKGYIYLPHDAKKAVSLASLLYQWILETIEQNDYDVFTKSARTSGRKKLTLALRWYIKNLG